MSLYHHSLAPQKNVHPTEWTTFATNASLEALEIREERERFAEPTEFVAHAPKPFAEPTEEQIARKMPVTDEDKQRAILRHMTHSKEWHTPTTPEELQRAFRAYAEHLAFLELHPLNEPISS